MLINSVVLLQRQAFTEYFYRLLTVGHDGRFQFEEVYRHGSLCFLLSCKGGLMSS
jgi:hypothetical protein